MPWLRNTDLQARRLLRTHGRDFLATVLKRLDKLLPRLSLALEHH